MIRRAQLAALGGARENEFIDWTARHISREYPDACAALDPEALHDWVRSAVHRARINGLQDPMLVYRFVALALQYGERFDNRPDIARALGDRAAAPETRLDRAAAAAQTLAKHPPDSR